MDRPRLLILLLACAVAGCSGGSSSHEPVTRLMAFTKLFPGERAAEVWTAHVDGSGAHRLVRGVAPSVSPDGRLVAFSRCTDRDLGCDLYVIEARGGRPRLLARKTDTLVWFPDSDSVVVGQGISTLTFTEALLSIDVDGGRRVELARGALYGWSVSPSGEEVVYARAAAPSAWGLYREEVDLYVVRAKGGAQQRLTADGRSGFPVWGPHAIAFSRLLPYRGWGRDEIWLIDPNGGDRRTLTGRVPKHLLGQGFAGLRPIAWSEDGNELVAARINEFGGPPYAVDPESGAIRRIGDFDLYAWPAGLSRDGRFVLVGEVGSGPDTDSRVAVVPYRGGPAPLIVTSAGSPSWNR